MSERLKILQAAFACRPSQGSEPELGWQWAFQAARFHDVTVLTRTSNRHAIEAELKALPAGVQAPRFAYHDSAGWSRLLEDKLKANPWFYYFRWQKSARAIVARLQREARFDVLHHVTWTEFRSTPAVLGHGVATVWGPVNGAEMTPWRLLPWGHPKACIHEFSRNVSTLIALRSLRKKGQACDAILVSTCETKSAFAERGMKTILLPESAQHGQPYQTRPRRNGALRLLFAGRMVFYKGIHLVLPALHASKTDAQLTIIGNGDFRPAMQRLSQRLGLEGRVRFDPGLAHEEMLERYQDFDVFIFPSLHDSSPMVVFEAMARGLPVICLDCAGTALAVRENCGIKVPVSNFSNIVRGLADAIRTYDQNRKLVESHGQNAWQSVMLNCVWDKKGERLDAIYRGVAARRLK